MQVAQTLSGYSLGEADLLRRAMGKKIKAEMDAQRARLGLAGLSARVTERDNAGRTVYRVRLGPFNSVKDAERARAQVQGAGMESALVRVQR